MYMYFGRWTPPYYNVLRDSKYHIAGIFQGVIFSWFLWSRGELRNIYPRKNRESTRVQRVVPRVCPKIGVVLMRPQNFFHEIPKITTFTKILLLKKYPLYGMHSNVKFHRSITIQVFEARVRLFVMDAAQQVSHSVLCAAKNFPRKLINSN